MTGDKGTMGFANDAIAFRLTDSHFDFLTM